MPWPSLSALKNKHFPADLLMNSKKHISDVLFWTGLFLVSLSGIYWYGRWQALSLNQSVRAEYLQAEATAPVAQERPSAPKHLFIPWKVDQTIESHVLTAEGNWTISEKQISYWMQSARPGENGNIILYGHNTRPILGNIRALKGGEIVTLTTEDDLKHEYKVTRVQQVSPEAVEWLEPTDYEVLTIYTCAGFMDRQRFVVQAEPVTPPPSEQAAPGQ